MRQPSSALLQFLRARLRNPFPARLVWALAGGTLVLLPTPHPVQGQDIWPERAEDLKVLPADISADDLRDTMREFATGLGVRCSFCHVGVEGDPLTTFGFVSDEKPEKEKARAMLEMMGDIRQHLVGIERSGPRRVDVGCHTCHAGKSRPMTLADAIGEVLAEDGTDAAVARFLSFRKSFFGGNQYDFSASGVNGMAVGFFQAGDPEAALEFLELNVEHYADWAEGHATLGKVRLRTGNREGAIRSLERALELAPDNEMIRRTLDRARGGGV